MKPIFFLLFVLLLAACTPAPSPVTATAAATLTVPAPSRTLPSSATIASTASQTPPAPALPTLTEFPTASETPEPTRTALPFPLTLLPTFDKRKVHKIQTQLPAVCPTKNPTIALAETRKLSEDDFLKYLNAGGDLNAFKRIDFLQGPSNIVDLTGDGIPEIFYNDDSFSITLYGCKNGQYESLISFDAPHLVRIEGITDLNKNGIPEVLVGVASSRNIVLTIYEWNGSEFRSLVENRYDPYDTSKVYNWIRGDYQMSDTNGDGLQEIIAVDDQTSIAYWEHFTPFNQINTFGWDGDHYVNMTLGNYLPPQYRFQAVQLGDREVLYKNYKKALSFYQSAIFDTSLQAWTPERLRYDLDHLYATPDPNDATPSPDPEEYDQLAAYATYRSMILHVYLGQVDIAKKEHERLLANFLPESPGFPYAEMASQFWKTYRASGNTADACQAAIQYATSHLEVLEPLWDVDTRGLEDHKYTPEDICPFVDDKK